MKKLTDEQALVALWAAIVLVLLLGLVLKTTVLIILALLGAAAAGYTTFLWLKNATAGNRSKSPADDAERNKGDST